MVLANGFLRRQFASGFREARSDYLLVVGSGFVFLGSLI
jgi:hypothetical protein